MPAARRMERLVMAMHSMNWIMSTVAVATLAAVACGGGSDSPTAPSDPGTGGGTVSDTATVTITSAGVVNPSTVTIRQGGRVMFVNNDTRPHDMSSDPHPSHEDCPPMAQVGFLSAGQSRTSGSFDTVRTCGFHDHNLPGDSGLQGRITIVAQ
jgi:plastocyanin